MLIWCSYKPPVSMQVALTARSWPVAIMTADYDNAGTRTMNLTIAIVLAAAIFCGGLFLSIEIYSDAAHSHGLGCSQKSRVPFCRPVEERTQ